MKSRYLILMAAMGACLLAGCSQWNEDTDLPAGMTLVKQHTPENKVGIAYNEYQLENGLTVVLHEDHSDPLVHVDVTYHVGSAREEPGRSGFAHFFEHMMFQGSQNVEDEQHFELITEAGGSMNGTTNSDRTNYYQTVPANQLEKVLWLEADRMGYLLDAVTQKKFEVQRETVKNERGQRYDNRPYGLRSETVAEALYPQGHPYSWPTIGYTEDLDRVNVNDLKRFFLRWYGPNNAVLTIGGDIDRAQTLAWVEKYFGPIAKGPAVDPAPKEPVQLEQDRYVTLEDNVHLPLLQITLPTVHHRHPDEAPLDVLADILGGGKTSLFYKNLVKTGLTVQAAVGHPCRELACEFQLFALANPQASKNLTQLQEVVSKTLSEFEQRGVNADDLARTKASIKSSTIYGLQSVAGKVSELAANKTFDGEADLVKYDVERYEAVTAEDVMRVYQKYVKDQPAVVLSIVPEGQTQLAVAESNYTPPERPKTEPTKTAGVNWQAPNDDFDRSQIPKIGPAPTISVPEYWKQKMDNGLQISGHYSDETPTILLSLTMEGGPLLESREQAGLASLTARMMEEGTQDSSAETIANQLAKLGSSIHFSASGRYTQVEVSALTENLTPTLNILEEMLFEPAFNEQDLARIKQQRMQSMHQMIKEPTELASRGQSLLLYGKDNRISLPDTGTLDSLASLTVEDVRRFYKQYYSPAKAQLVAVGNLSQQELLSHIDFLSQWQGDDYALPAYQPFPPLDTDKVFVINKPQAAQSLIRLFKPAPPYDATGTQFQLKLMNFPLGGMFNSRLNLKLREDKGWTYGASSRFSGGKTLGQFVAGANIKQAHTTEAIEVFFDEIGQYQQHGMSDEELEMMRRSYLQSQALDYETPSQKAGFLRKLQSYGLDRSVVKKQNQLIKTLPRRALNELAREHLKPESLALLVVGDKAKLEAQLAELEREIQLITVPL
ncbi:putative zinc protease [Saliniradius amylolyticus]|uniref:Putative zinc protease n=1 Tax=Saliniradius amylolyticus TaxID=2183582 RepID=A0A2S2E477_9ALTE|nr:pitrilysin family protein [Saliniradius amylolyticus]AWL12444.1 putative zinc protease [Saliniradius amylolyticus]